jgi:hypothetical protein
MKEMMARKTIKVLTGRNEAIIMTMVAENV